MMPKGQYINDSSYYVGMVPDEEHPNGKKTFFCCEGDYKDALEAYEESQNLQAYK